MQLHSKDLWWRCACVLFTHCLMWFTSSILTRGPCSPPLHNLCLQVIVGSAMHEFKCPGGSAERGRGVLEGVLRNYPKRTDLWSLYIDQVGEGSQPSGNVCFCRRLVSSHSRLAHPCSRPLLAQRLEGVPGKRMLVDVPLANVPLPAFPEKAPPKETFSMDRCLQAARWPRLPTNIGPPSVVPLRRR